MIFGEHLAIGVIGGALACIFSVLGTQMLIDSMVQWAFFFTVQVSLGSLAIIGGTVVLMSISLTPFGMWRIKKMDLVDRVKEFSN
jgi:ABC-type antimicrobial peptide transport system permease subunit